MPHGMTRRVEKALTAALVRTVQEPGKYHDGGGLGLQPSDFACSHSARASHLEL